MIATTRVRVVDAGKVREELSCGCAFLYFPPGTREDAPCTCEEDFGDHEMGWECHCEMMKSWRRYKVLGCPEHRAEPCVGGARMTLGTLVRRPPAVTA